MSCRYDEIIHFGKRVCNIAHSSSKQAVVSLRSLEEIGISITDLNPTDLRAACVALSFTLLYRGMNAVVMKDHVLLWDFTGKFLLEPPSRYFDESFDEPFPTKLHPLRGLFVSVIKSATREWELTQQEPISRWRYFQSPLGYPVALHTNPASYMVYPLLEAVTKRYLSGVLELNGYVKCEFCVKYGNKKIKYRPGRTCSSVSDMLALLQDRASSDLQRELQEIYDHIAFVTGSKRHPLDIISREWRNPSLHGEDHVPTAYGVLLNIVLLIALDYTTTRGDISNGEARSKSQA
jgi:hypothetical protein